MLQKYVSFTANNVPFQYVHHVFPRGIMTTTKKVDIVVNIRNQRSVIESDLKELKISIYPKLHEVKTNLQAQRSGVSKHSQKLRKALTEQAEAINNEIDTIIKDIRNW